MNISVVDIVIVIVLLAFVFYMAIRKRPKTLDEYWVNRRQTGTLLLVASLASTVIGAGTVFGIVSIGYQGGTVAFYLGFANAAGLLMVGLVAPKLSDLTRRHDFVSIGDFLAARYSLRCRLAGAVVTIFVYFFLMAAQFTALGAFIVIMSGVSFYIAIIIAGTILLLYTAFGGLRSDLITDAYQFVIMLVMAFVLCFFVFIRLGGDFSAFSDLPPDYWTGQSYGGISFLLLWKLMPSMPLGATN